MTNTTINAERCPDCAATAPYWRPDDRECEICLALAEMPNEIGELADALDNLPGILGADYGAVLRLRQIHGLLEEHVRALAAERDAMQDLLGSIWLYVGWRSSTRSLTTEQRELWADAVDAECRKLQIEDGEEPRPVAERWWRDV